MDNFEEASSWRVLFICCVISNYHDWNRRIGSNHVSSHVISLKRKLYLSSLFQPQTNNTKNSVVSAVMNAMKESNTTSSTPMVPHLHLTLFLLFFNPSTHLTISHSSWSSVYNSVYCMSDVFETVLHVLKIARTCSVLCTTCFSPMGFFGVLVSSRSTSGTHFVVFYKRVIRSDLFLHASCWFMSFLTLLVLSLPL